MVARMSATLEKKLDKVLPALTEKINSLGGVAKRKDIESLYGRQLIAMAVEKGHFKSVTVMRRDKASTRPIEKYSVICNSTWDRRTKPYWMD